MVSPLADQLNLQSEQSLRSMISEQSLRSKIQREWPTTKAIESKVSINLPTSTKSCGSQDLFNQKTHPMVLIC
jgi:hypothetical protein